ncbi:MAG TPA: IclR family transcriptional regulator [Bryobacteraceae bacterium]|nr:IclR family transcriptional regulator [Bryobacteraceae bacterium]
MQKPTSTPVQSAQPNGIAYLRRSNEVSSVRKALELLGCFSPQAPSWPLSELARHLQIPKSTAHNLLRTLQSLDFVRQSPETRTYQLGPRAMELGLVFASNSDILSHARTVMNRLAEKTGETVKIGILSNDQVLIMAAVESAHQLHTRGDLGTRWPLHSSSLGKAILSTLQPEELAEVLGSKGMRQFTKNTISTLEEMELEVKRIRARGYAVDQQENEAGVCCVAAPISATLQGVSGAIGVSGPCVRIRDKAISELGQQVMAASQAIARYTGY